MSNHSTIAILRRPIFLLSLCIFLTTAGCGVKGPLVKQGVPLPSAAVAPTIQQQGNDALLSWTIPSTNQDGTRLDNLQKFLVSRRSYLPGDYCEECRDPVSGQTKIYRDLGTGQIHIYTDRPEPAILVKDRLYLRDQDLKLNQGYRYRIVAINDRDEAGAELLTHRVMLPAPQPPERPQAVPLDRSLRIKWTNGTNPPGDGQFLGVNLYRAIADAPFGPKPINSKPLTDEVYNDFGLENNQTYSYSLRNVIKIDDQIIESDLSESVTATPEPAF